MEGLLYAALVHSTIARGRIAGLDTAAAEAAPGVVLVMTYRNAPKLAVPPPIGLTNLKAAGNNVLPVMQDDEIRWNGQTVARGARRNAGTGRSCGIAGAGSLRSRRGAHALRGRQGRCADAGLDPDREEPPRSRATPKQALETAAHRVDRVYRTPWHNHNPIEPHAATIVWQGERLIVHDATQMLNGTAGSLAKVFGIKEDQVHVSSPFVGGGFGGKALWDHQILAAAAAKLAGRPVRIVLPRVRDAPPDRRTDADRATRRARRRQGRQAAGAAASRLFGEAAAQRLRRAVSA